MHGQWCSLYSNAVILIVDRIGYRCCVDCSLGGKEGARVSRNDDAESIPMGTSAIFGSERQRAASWRGAQMHWSQEQHPKT
jgi:hypothetical protein